MIMAGVHRPCPVVRPPKGELKRKLNLAEMTTMKWHKYPQKTLSYTCKFDFEVGYLVQSPCRACTEIGKLPACSRS